MAKIKQEKLAVDIQRYISEIIQFEMGHINVGMVTVTKVKVSDDNSWAKVYVSFLDKDREKKLEDHPDDAPKPVWCIAVLWPEPPVFRGGSGNRGRRGHFSFPDPEPQIHRYG